MSTLSTTNLKNPSSGSNNIVLDSSGRVLVGTSSSSVNTSLVLNGSSSGAGNPGIAYLQRNEATPGSGSALGQIFFANNAGNAGALISSECSGTWTSGSSHPSALVFSTTASGAASPTERFRISSTGAQSSVIPGGSTLYPSFDCRAWVNFDGTTATPSTIRGHGNISSITKNGTGDYSVNFINTMPDNNYALAGSANHNRTDMREPCYMGPAFISEVTTTYARIRTGQGGFTATDSSLTSVVIFR
jgi:hypothetical protein